MAVVIRDWMWRLPGLKGARMQRELYAYLFEQAKRDNKEDLSICLDALAIEFHSSPQNIHNRLNCLVEKGLLIKVKDGLWLSSKNSKNKQTHHPVYKICYPEEYLAEIEVQDKLNAVNQRLERLKQIVNESKAKQEIKDALLVFIDERKPDITEYQFYEGIRELFDYANKCASRKFATKSATQIILERIKKGTRRHWSGIQWVFKEDWDELGSEHAKPMMMI